MEFRSPNRRDLLCAGLAGGVMAAGAGPLTVLARESGADQTPLTATPLAANMLLVAGAGGNVVVSADSDGLLMVDGGLESRSAELLDFVQRETGETRIHTLINTHWHPEQTGSNPALGEAGAAILAHENTRLWMGQNFWVRWQDRHYPAFAEAARPNRTFYTTLDLPHGGGAVELSYMLQAHTDGDILVHFPDSDVIVSGGVGGVESWPVLDWGTGGWIIGLMDGLDAVTERAGEATMIVPSDGRPATRAELVEQRVLFETIQREMLRLIRMGQSLDEIIHLHNPVSGLAPEWGDPAQFLSLTYHGMVMQMRGHRMRIA